MEGTKEEVLAFLEKCGQLKSSKFIMATAAIKDLLKCVVNSPSLYKMFKAVTGDFDYAAAKRTCLVTTSNGFFNRSYLKLPEEPVDKLAFIFCLLVEFDHETINFTSFLLQFFPEDGSCYASFHNFCDCVIVTLEDLIKEVFKDELSDKKPVQVSAVQNTNESINALSLLIANERDMVLNSLMPEKDKQDGVCLLDEIECSIREGRKHSLEAALCGYDYFSRCHNNFSQFIDILNTEL